MNLRLIDARTVGISLDETTTLEEVKTLVSLIGGRERERLVPGAGSPESRGRERERVEDGRPIIEPDSLADVCSYDAPSSPPTLHAPEGAAGNLASGFASLVLGAASLELDTWNLELPPLPAPHARQSAFLTHSVFNSFHAEHEMLRYIKRLEARDLSLCHSMISLGSCTMKLNATTEMLPVTWPEFGRLHPFAPAAQTARLPEALWRSRDLAGRDHRASAAVSLQPNAGSQGEYAGLLVIRAWHASRGEGHRNVCLIPTSAHGTNPASAAMGGFKVVPVACDAQGNIDVADLRAKAEAHAANLAALMVTYPSTHGVFEAAIKDICADRPPAWRPGVHGRRQHERAGRPDLARLHRRRCLPPEPPQDLLPFPHGGGGPGRGTHRRGRAPCRLPARTSASRRIPDPKFQTPKGFERRGFLRRHTAPPRSSSFPGSTSA